MKYTGGCCCGALQYESTSAPVECGFCHCRLCQKTSAAPVLVYASFHVSDFRYSTGNPAIYASSVHGHREFCANCGTQIAFRGNDNPKSVDVNVGSLDDPSIVTPECHIWYESRIPWFVVNDHLPKHLQDRQDRE